MQIPLPTGEAKVETDADDIRNLLEIDRSPAQTDDLRLEADRGIAEIIVAVLDKGRKAVGQAIFGAAANRPSRPRLARGISRPEDEGRSPVIIAFPPGTSFT